ncbi:MAG: DNA repair protein RecN [Clostridiales bacterium]|nr:DNA repair protein RecN [Clostridiales bacterium]
MLQNLHVKNLALIRETEVNFGPGLNILTGETGAGKSILIGSIHLALGERVSKDMLRENADSALVELIFTVDEPGQIAALDALDIIPDDGQIIMTRKVSANGRSVCRINGETYPAAVLRKVAGLLIDIHGQQEHVSLLAKKNHLAYLDAYAKKRLGERPAALAESYRSYTECRRLLEEASLDGEQQKRELSFLEYEINEIDEAGLTAGEDEELETAYRRLSHGRKIMDAAAEARECCADGTENASDLIGRAARELFSVEEYDGNAKALAGQLSEIDSLLSDFNRDLAGYIDDFEFSGELFARTEERLDLINHLKSKYGRTIEDILASREEKAARVDKLNHYEEYRADLEAKCTAAENDLRKISQEVSDIRKSEAVTFTDGIKQALLDLNFNDVRLSLEFTQLDHYTANGTDDARFFISTNPGEPLKPLDSVASGGELSRIMLALKTVLAGNDDIETLIFDEIDSGISGRTAQMVAEKIKQTAASHQVICITHLPQIAAMADSHFLIEKTSDSDSTISSICLLSEDESIDELARMLGGTRITDSVRSTAEEMKNLASQLLAPASSM